MIVTFKPNMVTKMNLQRGQFYFQIYFFTLNHENVHEVHGQKTNQPQNNRIYVLYYCEG